MAKMNVMGLNLAEDQLERLGRIGIRDVVAAGAQAVEEAMRRETKLAGHVRNGNLAQSYKPGKLYESLNAAVQWVDAQGSDPRSGYPEREIAWITDYKSIKGKGFLTKNWKQFQQEGEAAMKAKAEELLARAAE